MEHSPPLNNTKKKRKKEYKSIYKTINIDTKKKMNLSDLGKKSQVDSVELNLVPCDNYYVLTYDKSALSLPLNFEAIWIQKWNELLKDRSYKYYVDSLKNFEFKLSELNTTRRFIIIEFTNNNIDNKFISLEHQYRKKLIELLTSANEDYILNVIPAFHEYQSDNKYFLERIRFFLPDECIIQVKEDCINKNLPRDDKIFIDDLEGNEIQYPIICHQKTQGYYTLDISNNANSISLLDSIKYLSEFPCIEFVEPSEIANGNTSSMIDHITTHHRIDRLVESHRTLATWGIQQIRMRDAWSIHRGKSSVYIAIIDYPVVTEVPDQNSQVLIHHPAFHDAKISIYDFASYIDRDYPIQKEHGDQMAGSICAIDVEAGYLGVAPKCSIMSLGVNLQYGQVSARVDAINYIVDLASQTENKGNRYVINCSWHIQGKHQGLNRALERVKNQYNVCLIAAAGNFRHDPGFVDIKQYPILPASDSRVITVGASGIDKKPLGWSGRGEKILDVCAPGEDIVALNPNSSKLYEFSEGTSYSCAYVSGLVGLMWSVAPELLQQDIRKILQDQCIKFESDRDIYGEGIINAQQTLAKSVLQIPSSFSHLPEILGKKLVFLIRRLLELIYLILVYGIIFRSQDILILIVQALFPAIPEKVASQIVPILMWPIFLFLLIFYWKHIVIAE